MRRVAPRGLPAIDIMPYEYRRRHLSRLGGILLFVLLAGAVLTALSFQNLQAALEQTATLQERQHRLTIENDNLKAQEGQATALRQRIAALQADLDKTQKLREALAVRRLDWGGLLSPVLLSLPAGIELTTIVKEPKQRMTIEGTSNGGFAPLEQYYNQLSHAPGVSAIVITRTDLKEEKQGSILTFSLVLTIAGE